MDHDLRYSCPQDQEFSDLQHPRKRKEEAGQTILIGRKNNCGLDVEVNARLLPDDTFIDFTIKFTIYQWCKQINRLLNGEDTRIRNNMDHIQKLASERYRTTLKSKKRK
ncbi:hypothetical protein CBL_10510 [Carabus blaptoides fortunei]